MFRPLLSAVLSAALVLPLLNAPSYADQRGYAHRHGTNGPLHLPPANDSPSVTGSGTGQTIAVLGGLALAIALAKQAREREERREAARKRDDDHRFHDNHRRTHLRVIPERCYREGRGWRGFGARCMERHVARPSLLPDRCLRRVQTNRGGRSIYRERCLRREGWTRQFAEHRD